MYESKVSTPIITAHSGADGTSPNSVEFIEEAARRGADFAELDVRVSSDGIVVFHHDGELEGLSVAGTDFDALRDASGNALPEGRTVLETLTGTDLYLNADIKAVESIEPLVKLLKELGLEDRVVFSGIKIGDAPYVRKEFSHIPCMLNVDNGSELREQLSTASDLGCYMINMKYTHWTRELIELTKESGLGTSAWTVNEEEDLQMFIDDSVDSITTLRVSLLKSLLA